MNRLPVSFPVFVLLIVLVSHIKAEFDLTNFLIKNEALKTVLKRLGKSMKKNLVFDNSITHILNQNVNLSITRISNMELFKLLLKMHKLKYEKFNDSTYVITRYGKSFGFDGQTKRFKVFKLNYIDPATVFEVLRTTSPYKERIDILNYAPVRTKTGDYGIYAYDNEKNFKLVEELLGNLDIKPKDVLVKVKILQVKSEFLKRNKITGEIENNKIASRIILNKLESNIESSEITTLKDVSLRVQDRKEASIDFVVSVFLPGSSIQNGASYTFWQNVDIGLKLSVRPYIRGKWVDLDIKLSDSESDDKDASGIKEKRMKINSRKFSSSVKVKSGETVFIGGLLEDTNKYSNGYNKVSYTNLKNPVKKHLILLVTPTIIK